MAKPLKLDKLLVKIEEVSTIPHIIAKVMTVVESPNTGAKDLAKVVETDPALAIQILKYVNSVSQGLRIEVHDIQQAVAYLGFREVREMAVAMTVAEIFKDPKAIGAYSRKNLWEHMVSVAVVAKTIAESIGLESTESVFLAGLLRDIGIILKDQYLHPHFDNLMENFPTGKTLIETEQELFGYSHATLGDQVAEKWAFPEVVKIRSACITPTPATMLKSSVASNSPTSSAHSQTLHRSVTSWSTSASKTWKRSA
jgi:HD-like signal output (HDOD) protein